MVTVERAQVANYELSIVIEKPRKTVWKALTAETNSWWLPSFHLMGEGSVVSLRAEAGGHLIEKREDGGSMIWYTVKSVNPLNAIEFFGQNSYGGATVNLMKCKLEDHPSGTRLVVSDSYIGQLSEKGIDQLRHGWNELFTKGLKTYCETRGE